MQTDLRCTMKEGGRDAVLLGGVDVVETLNTMVVGGQRDMPQTTPRCVPLIIKRTGRDGSRTFEVPGRVAGPLSFCRGARRRFGRESPPPFPHGHMLVHAYTYKVQMKLIEVKINLHVMSECPLQSASMCNYSYRINTNLPSRKWNEWVNEEVEIGKTESIYIEAPEKS